MFFLHNFRPLSSTLGEGAPKQPKCVRISIYRKYRPTSVHLQECPISDFAEEFPLGFYASFPNGEFGHSWVGGHPWSDTSYLDLQTMYVAVTTTPQATSVVCGTDLRLGQLMVLRPYKQAGEHCHFLTQRQIESSST